MDKSKIYILAKNTKNDGKIDDPQEVYNFLRGFKEDDNLMQLISSFTDVYIGCGDVYSDVMIEADHHDQVLKSDNIPVTADDNSLFVILPSQYTPVIMMSGFEVPVTQEENVTVDDVTYKVLKSDNIYTGNFSIMLQ